MLQAVATPAQTKSKNKNSNKNRDSPQRKSAPVRAKVESKRQNVLIAGDHPLTRKGIGAVIGVVDGLVICGEVGTGAEVLAALDLLSPDILIVDVSLRNGMGIRFVEACKQHSSRLKILAISCHEEWLHAGRTLRAGAMAYLSKMAEPELLIQAVQNLAAGKAFVSPDMMTRMLAGTSSKQADDPISTLTQREIQVFELIGAGKTSHGIAKNLELSVHTVETYRERLKVKLDVKHGADLTFQAIVWRLLHE